MHFSRADAVRLAGENGLAATPDEVARHLLTLVDLGLLGRVPTTAAEPVFDTVPQPHFHVVYDETEQTVDLRVSAETLLAILRHALLEQPERVEVLVRFRRDVPPTPERANGAQAGRRQVERGR